MRRVVLAIALLAGCAPATAAAAPRAVDFERAVASDGRARAASSVVTVDPGRRFDVVGLRWRSAPEDPHLELRVRAGGRWKGWVDFPALHAGRGSDPVLAPRAEALQLRGTRGIRGLRAHFVRVTGARRAAPRARAAQAGPPPIIGRDQWEAGQCTPRDGPTMGSVQMAFVHHTVSANDYAPEESAGMVLGICRFHRNTNGWDDLGYNFLVDKYGQVFEGRAGGIDQPVVGAQAQGWNDQSTGISNLGTHEDLPQTDQALDAMARLLAWKLPLHGAPVTGTVTLTSGGGGSNRHPAGQPVTYERISGHRDGNATACPGQALYDQLPRLREMAAGRAPAVIGPGPAVGAASSLTLAAQRPDLAFPEPARLTGRLADPTGGGVGGARVRIQILTATGYQSIGPVVFTDPSGGFAAELPTRRNRTIRALVGNIASPPVKVTVAPALRLVTPPRRVLAGRRAVLRGSLDPRKGSVAVRIARQVGGRYVHAAALKVPVRGGRFRGTPTLRRPGLYRLRVVFRGDRLNAPSAAPDAFVRAVRRLSAVSGGQAAR